MSGGKTSSDAPEQIRLAIKELSERLEKFDRDLQVLRKGQIELAEILPSKLEKIASSFKKSMEAHLDIIKKFRRESEIRTKEVGGLTVALKETLEALPSKIAEAIRNLVSS